MALKDFERRAYLQLHTAIFLYGLTAIFGKLIQLSALVLIWWRLLITSVVFLIFSHVWITFRALPKTTLKRLSGIGVLVMIHWLCFYGSIKYSNASVALITFSTNSFFSALLEPLFDKKPIQKYDIVLSLLILPAIGLVGGEIPAEMNIGFWLGIAAGFLSAVFSILNKNNVHLTDSATMTFTELLMGFLVITLLMFAFYIGKSPAIHPFFPNTWDWLYLILLAVLCTNIAYVLTLRAMQHVSAFTANLSLNLEPVYGIALAIPMLHEDKQLTPAFYLGGGWILMTVLMYPFLKKGWQEKS